MLVMLIGSGSLNLSNGHSSCISDLVLLPTVLRRSIIFSWWQYTSNDLEENAGTFLEMLQSIYSKSLKGVYMLF